jgi:hypothetical protein
MHVIARPFFIALIALAVAAAVGTPGAGACSCANLDPRDQLEKGRPALVGRVVSKTGLEDSRTRYVVRVERALNVRLGREVAVVGWDDEGGCGFSWRVGQRVAAFLYRDRGAWTANLCTLARPAEIERALKPYPRPRGQGRLALLAGGSFGEARLMALDERGRVLGYGFGQGGVRAISVCPGSGAAAELVQRGRTTLVAVRSLTTLEVLRSTAVHGSISQIHCADAASATVYAVGLSYSGRPVKGRARVLRIDGAGVATVFTAPAEQIGLGPGAAYIWSDRQVEAISLADGSRRPLVQMGLPEHIAPSPDGRLVAIQGFDERLRMIDLGGGAPVTIERDLVGVLAWIGPDRLLTRTGGRTFVYDTRLQLVRRYRFYRAYLQAPFGGGVFGTAYYRLVRLDLDSGRKDTVAILPDRGIADLAGVPDAPLVDLPRRAPAGFSGTARRTRSARAGRPGARTARWSCARSPRG